MQKKYLPPILLVITFSLLISIWLGYNKRKQSDAILDQFKMIDSSLVVSNHAIEDDHSSQQSNEDLIQNSYSIAREVSTTILYIDSLHDFVLSTAADREHTVKTIISDDKLRTLKARLSRFNKVVKQVDSSCFIINLNSGSISSKGKTTWEDFYFRNTSAVAVATYLVYLKNQVLEIQQKLIENKSSK